MPAERSIARLLRLGTVRATTGAHTGAFVAAALCMRAFMLQERMVAAILSCI